VTVFLALAIVWYKTRHISAKDAGIFLGSTRVKQLRRTIMVRLTMTLAAIDRRAIADQRPAAAGSNVDTCQYI
jgi:hypothetical protein